MYDDALAPVSTADDRAPLAIAAGVVAALLGGAAWAALVHFTQYEVGWAAWGIGAFVGWAMSRATARRSRGLAVTAAALALVGLFAGKAFVTAASVGPIADELVESTETLEGALAWDMYSEGMLDPATMEAIAATEAAGDMLSDALWAEMRRQSADRLAGMTAEERQAVAEGVARGYVGQLGLVGGVRAQLSPFDALWILLALGTAFRLMDAQPVEFAIVPGGSGRKKGEGVPGGPPVA